VRLAIRLSARQRPELRGKRSDQCATDADTPWIDPKPAQAIFGVHYRVTAYNSEGKLSAPSAKR